MKAILTTTNLKDGQFWRQEELASGAVDCVHQVTVYPDVRYQTFEGFGGAFTEASAYVWQQLPPERKQALLELYFGEDGLRYTQGRVHMGSCDFSLGNYACQTGPGDEGFHTEHDDQYLIPMIQAAQAVAGRPIELLLSPWSPPGFMKTNGEMNHGGSLKRSYRARWAECMAKYAAHYRSAGCDVRRMSIQNEPAAVQTWDSCIWSGAEEGTFAAECLVPALKKAGCGDVKILAWDHNKEILVQRARETLSAEGAAEAVGGFAVHWYTGDHFEALRIVKGLWPDKELWFSEGCVEYSRFDGTTPLQKAEMYAHDILGNLNGGISGSIDWNLLLDARGGPNHAGNFCEAPVMMTEDSGDFTIQSEYYCIGQFSRFIRPGAVRLGSSAWTGSVEVTAFENRNGGRTAVVLNRTERETAVSITEDAREAWNFVMAPHSIATFEWR